MLRSKNDSLFALEAGLNEKKDCNCRTGGPNLSYYLTERIKAAFLRYSGIRAEKDNSPSEVEAVRQYMPQELQGFLPLKYLH